MANVSLAEAVRLRDQVSRFKHATRKAREKAGEVVTDLVRAAEVSGVAAALGYWAGTTKKAGGDHPAFFGIPADLAVGVASHVLGIMGVGGAEDHFKAIGDGGLATYFSTLGYSAGLEGKGFLKGDSGQSSLPGKMSGAALTADDLAKLATE